MLPHSSAIPSPPVTPHALPRLWAKIRREPAICVVLFGVLGVFLGFVREQAVASRIGVSMETDAFYLASALILFVPSLVNGACQGILAPQFARRMLQSGPDAAKRLLEQLLVIILALGVAAALVQVSAEFVVHCLSNGPPSTRTKLTLVTGAWLALTVPPLCFSTAGVAALNVMGRYWLGAASAGVAPLAATVALYLPNPSISTLVAGVVIGLNLQALLLAWALSRQGIILTRIPSWSSTIPLLRDLAVVATGVVASAASPLAIQTVVAGLGDSALTTYTLGTKITAGFIGLSALILSSVLTPLFAARASGLPYSRARFRAYLWLTAVACTAVTLVLVFYSENVISLFLGQALAPAQLARVARLQSYAALQFPAFILLFLGMRAVQAYHDVKFVSAMNWAQGGLTLIFGSALHHYLGLLGILVAVAVAYAICGTCYLLKYRQMKAAAKQAYAGSSHP